jgi:DNA topoisomerase VI subunit B
MQLDNAKRDYLVDVDEETTKMSISKDVESHIIKVLTEHSYDDPLGSSIREAVSNAVDSVAEAGTNMPVIVHIRMNEAGAKELVIEDKGLGLDDASFKKYIMGLGESTKRNSSTLLGGLIP